MLVHSLWEKNEGLIPRKMVLMVSKVYVSYQTYSVGLFIEMLNMFSSFSIHEHGKRHCSNILIYSSQRNVYV